MKRAAAGPTSDSRVSRPEPAPARSADRFETLARLAPVGIFECDLTGCCTFINDVWQAIHHEPAAAALGFGWLERVHPDDRGQFQPRARAFEGKGEQVEQTFRIVRPSGELRTLRIRLAKLRSTEGVHVGWAGTFEDVTETLLENEVNDAARRQQAALAELTSLALPQSDARAVFESVAQRAREALAADRVDIVDPEGNVLARAGREAAPLDEVVCATLGHAHADYGRIEAAWPVAPPAALKAVNVSFLQSLASVLSVWLQRQKQRLWLRAVFERSVDPMLRLRTDGTILEANLAAARAVGVAAPDLAGQPIQALGFSERARAAWDVALQQVRASRQSQSFEFTLLTAAGERPYAAQLDLVVDDAGRLEFLTALLHDSSDRIAQEQLANLQQELLDREDRLDALLRNLLGERAALRERARAWGLAALTTREQTILRLMATGKTNREIGATLGMSPGTVRNRISLLLPKLGAADRTQAVAIAIQSGLLDTFNVQPTDDVPLRAFNLGEFE